MRERERDTLETNLATVIVVVGGPDVLVEAVQRVADGIPGASVETCGLRNAATTVAKMWPFAIVMSEDMYAFDPTEFDALARDVAALLQRTGTDGESAQSLELKLRPPLLAAVYARFE